MTEAAAAPPAVPLLERWRAAWPQALAAWSRFTRLHDPHLCERQVEAAKEGLSGSFAMIRFADQGVVVDLETVRRLGLEDCAVEVLAHEVGHHVLMPGSATDQFRLLARIRRALPTLEKHAPLVANLYADLLINDRLQRQAGLRMDAIYARLAKTASQAPPGGLWGLYLRICEILWKLEKGALGGVDDGGADAWLGARLVRVYAKNGLGGAGRFATLVLPYLLKDLEGQEALRVLHDTKDAARDCEPAGLHEIDPEEETGAIHPSQDPEITGFDDEETAAKPREETAPAGGSRGQAREPFEYGEVLKAAGVTLSDQDIAVRYYRERALPHLVAFPTRPAPESPEPQLEGLEPWDIGDPLDEIDWTQTAIQSPRVVPGLTTVRRQYGREAGRHTAPVPVDLDLYVDSSGSMPNPQAATSYLTLAGAIIALSALRVGSRVQATLWSGTHQVTVTDGFVRNQDAVLRVLTGYYGGGTAFPIHRLRDTFARRKRTDRPVHILVISDSGVDTMFATDEQGSSGWTVAALALERGRAGGTMVLNLTQAELDDARYPIAAVLKRARQEQGWVVERVSDWSELVAFARAFSRRHYTAPRAQGMEAAP